MKKIILFALCFLLFATIAFSADLVCDPDPDHVKYKIEGFAQDMIIIDAIEHALKYPLSDLAPGDYSINVWAINAWGEEAGPVPFSFRRPEKNPAVNIKVVSP